jgi:hypothetical protein
MERYCTKCFLQRPIEDFPWKPLCDYKGETTPSNNLEYMAEEKMT